MTIRDFVKYQTWKRVGLPLMVVAVVAAAATIVFPAPADSWVSGALFLCYAAAIVVSVVGLARLRCPRCHKGLGAVAVPVAFRLFGRKVTACPRCGVSLDEPMHPSRKG
jgi:uncharacterized C2H2 Zn-finger protein